MAEGKHTPGPWTVKADRRGASKLYVRTAELSPVQGATAGRAVAQVTAVVGFEEQEANARLIAAAPAMLKALRITADNLSTLNAARADQGVAQFDAWRDVVEAAIRASEGA